MLAINFRFCFVFLNLLSSLRVFANNNDILDYSAALMETRVKSAEGDDDEADAVLLGADYRKHKEKFDEYFERLASAESAVNGGNASDVDNATRLNITADMEVDYDIYMYDMEDSLLIFDWGELVPTLAVYTLTMALGITGNALIIFTICQYRKMKSTTNVFLASLASADLLLITICIPVKLAKLFSYTWTMGLFLCKLVHYMQSVSAICSVLTLTAMSIERYYAIVHPMKAKYVCTISQARRIILCTWAASFVLAVPILFTQVQMPVGQRIKAHWCVKDWDNPILWRFHELYMLLLILVVPTIVMAIAYSSICWEIFRVMQRRHDMTTGQGLKPVGSRRGVEHIPLRYSKRAVNGGGSGHHTSLRESLKKVNNIKTEEENNTVKQVIKMLVAVVVLFVICWAPMLIDNVLTAYGVLDHIRMDRLKHMGTAFHLMAYFNSCINPIVYGFMSKNFRESFYKALCRCCHRGRVPKRAMSMSQTRTTSVRFGRNVSMSSPPVNY